MNINTQKKPNPLAVILFVFGALHGYDLAKKQKITSFKLIKKGIQIQCPLFLKIFIGICIGTTLLEASESWQTSLQ